MSDEEFFEEIAARLDDFKEVPIGTLLHLVTRDGTCMWIDVGIGKPMWTESKATDRDLAAHICAGCPVVDECLELDFRTAGTTTLGVWGALAEDDRRATYLAWLRRRGGGDSR
jgi:WhiB family redox-sensing transcriptional regulator